MDEANLSIIGPVQIINIIKIQIVLFFSPLAIELHLESKQENAMSTGYSAKYMYFTSTSCNGD